MASAKCRFSTAGSQAWVITFSDGSVGFQEVGLEIDLKEVPCDPFHGVINGQHVDALAVLHIRTRLDAEKQKCSPLFSGVEFFFPASNNPPFPALGGPGLPLLRI